MDWRHWFGRGVWWLIGAVAFGALAVGAWYLSGEAHDAHQRSRIRDAAEAFGISIEDASQIDWNAHRTSNPYADVSFVPTKRNPHLERNAKGELRAIFRESTTTQFYRMTSTTLYVVTWVLGVPAGVFFGGSVLVFAVLAAYGLFFGVFFAAGKGWRAGAKPPEG